MKFLIVLVVLFVIAAVVLTVVNRRKNQRAKAIRARAIKQTEGFLAEHRKIQSTLAQDRPRTISGGSALGYSGTTRKVTPTKPKTSKPSRNSDDVGGYAYEAPDYGYSVYDDSSSRYSSGSSDSGSSGYSSGSSYDSGSSSSSSSYDSGSSSSSSDSSSSW
jgi:uncharacterized membrane protein YgcG